MSKRKVNLSLSSMDERINPTSVTFGNPSAQTLIAPQPVTETEFVVEQISNEVNGKVWAVGQTLQKGDYVYSFERSYGIVRLNSDGSIDPTFNGGKVKDYRGVGDLTQLNIGAIKQDNQGRLYVLSRDQRDLFLPATTTDRSSILPPFGDTRSKFTLLRFDTAGALDTSFNEDGKTRITIDKPVFNLDIEVAANGSVFVAGGATEYVQFPFSSNGVLSIVKLTPNGDYDNSFDEDGKLSRIYGIGLIMTDMNLLADGSIMVAGSYEDGLFYAAVVGEVPDNRPAKASLLFSAKFDANGQPDSNYNVNGFVSIRESYFGVPNIYSSDSYILPTGEVVNLSFASGKAFITKQNADGSLNKSFDGDGIKQITFTTDYEFTGISIVPLAGDGIGLLGSERYLNGVLNPTAELFRSVVSRLSSDGNLVTQTNISNSNFYRDLVTAGPNLVAIANNFNQNDVLSVDLAGKTTQWTIPLDSISAWAPPADFQAFGPGVLYESVRADVNGDSVSDYVFVTREGIKSSIRIVNGSTGVDIVSAFQPYEDGFVGGMYVDCGDFNGDGKAEVVVSPRNGGSGRVQVFSLAGNTLANRANFYGIGDPNFRGGASIGVSDIDDDGVVDLVVGAGFTGSQRVANYNGRNIFNPNGVLPTRVVNDYFAPFLGIDPKTYRRGVNVKSVDLDGDGRKEIRFEVFSEDFSTSQVTDIVGREQSGARRIRFNIDSRNEELQRFLNMITGQFEQV